MIYLDLLFTFLKIGLFTFGGGYGMIPLVQQAVVGKGWLDAETLYQYIGICESTPGPIAINMATFVGSSQAGFWGSICATLGVVIPSFVIILLIAAVLKNFRENRYVNAALTGIRPVIGGVITATGAYVFLKCLIANFDVLSDMHADIRQIIVAAMLGIGMFVWCKLLKKKFSPILLIVFSAVCGIIVYGL